MLITYLDIHNFWNKKSKCIASNAIQSDSNGQNTFAVLAQNTYIATGRVDVWHNWQDSSAKYTW